MVNKGTKIILIATLGIAGLLGLFGVSDMKIFIILLVGFGSHSVLLLSEILDKLNEKENEK